MSKFNALTDTVEGIVFEAQLGLIKCRACNRHHPFFITPEEAVTFIGTDIHSAEFVESFCKKYEITPEILMNNRIVVCSCGSGFRIPVTAKEEVEAETKEIIKE
jgi:hypothetical protein